MTHQLSIHEKHQLLSISGGREVVYNPERTVITMFREQVTKRPTAIAVVDENTSLSYLDLDTLSDSLAARLQAKYLLGNNQPVAILMDRSAASVVSILAVLKCGAAYLPIDTSYPLNRVNYMLEDSGCSLLICTEEHYSPELKAPYIEIYSHSHTHSHFHSHSHSSPAYIIYTSGSTGKPKGVKVSHAALSDYVHTFIDYFKPGETDVLLHHSSISFDTAVEEIFVSLCSGMKLAISKEGGKNMDLLVSAMSKHRVTMISATPLLINELNKRAGKNLSLRVVLSGGEELKPAFIDKLILHTNIYNSYGPTENTICVTYHHIKLVEDAHLIGRPISNRAIYIVDEHLELLPAGQAGEICIAGKGIADGYVNAPELTAQKFVDNPFSENEKMFRSGDIGRWTADGILEFLGRKDEQVKINGYRIELREIEHALLQHQEIKDVRVLPKQINENKILVAYYVADKEIGKDEITGLLKQTLPDYMIPANCVQTDHIPLLANGKTDKQQLLNIAVKEIKLTGEVINSTEKKLRESWMSVLEISQVSVSDQFFEAGGNSLLLTRLFDLIDKDFPGIFTVADLFNQTTIRKQADFILSKSTKSSYNHETVSISEIEL